MSGRHRLWAYGSLMAPDSLLTTLGPEADLRSTERLVVTGWRRAWCCLSRRTFLDADGRRVRRVVLGVEPADGVESEGLMLDVGRGDMDRLRIREQAYDEVDLGEAVTFVPVPAHRRGAAQSGYPLVVERGYYEMCVRGAREHGLEGAVDELTRTLDLPLVEPAGGIRMEPLRG